MGTDGERRYEAPTVRDYGTVLSMTAATTLGGTEDGGTKAVPTHHSTPPQP